MDKFVLIVNDIDVIFFMKYLISQIGYRNII